MAGRRYTEYQGSFRQDQASVTIWPTSYGAGQHLIKLALLGLCGFEYCMTETSVEGVASV